MLFQCWSSAKGGEPSLKQHWQLAYRNENETSNKTRAKRYSHINHVDDMTKDHGLWYDYITCTYKLFSQKVVSQEKRLDNK